MKKVFILLILSFIIFSCDREESILNPNATENPELVIDYNYESKLKLDFAKALALAFNESVPLREFIKEEALKMFNKDYEVLYYLVKDNKLSDGQSFRDVLLSFYEDENRLSEIENTNPLLTILVPELPENSFSAKIWNPQKEAPFVAIRMNTTNHVPVVSNVGEVHVLPGGVIPAFPVVVLKDNERVVINNSMSNKRSVINKNGVDSQFQFLDDAFNGNLENNENQIPSKRVVYKTDSKLLEAYHIYKIADGWHRDFIYYNLKPNRSKGQFRYDYKEHITSFSFNGNGKTAMQVYQRLSDQRGDPKLRVVHTSRSSNWTSGLFEFKIKILLNSKSGQDAEQVKFFGASPDELFDAKYKKTRGGWWTWPRIDFYELESLTFKRMKLNLPVMNWDLKEFASSIKLEFEEVDLKVSTKITEERNVKFANNFSIDGGVLKKIGLKFGSKEEITVKGVVTKSYTEGNDPLGSAIINFGDDVVIHRFTNHFTAAVIRDYHTGWVTFSFEPKRVQ